MATGSPSERVGVRRSRLTLPVELIALGQLAVLQRSGGGSRIVAVLEAMAVLVAHLIAVFVIHCALGSVIIVATHPMSTIGLFPLDGRLVDEAVAHGPLGRSVPVGVVTDVLCRRRRR